MLAGLAAGLLALPVAAGACLFAGLWLLAQGPVELGWALPRIEALLGGEGRARTASVSWAAFRDGPAAPARVEVGGARLFRAGVEAGRVDHAAVVLSVPSFRPRDAEATGVALQLRRGADGTVALAGEADAGGDADAPDLLDALRELAQPPSDRRHSGDALQGLQALRRVTLRDVSVRLHDAQAGGAWRLDLARLDLARPDAGGVQGEAEAVLAVGAARAELRLDAALSPDGGSRLALVLAPVSAGAVQVEAMRQGAEIPGEPGGHPVLDATVGGTAILLLDPALLPREAGLRLRAGGGRVRVAGAPIGFDALELDASAQWAGGARWGWPSAASLHRLRAVLHAPGGAWPSTLVADGRAARDGARVTGTATVALDHMLLADLKGVWPERLGGHARPWLVENISGGTARSGEATIGFATDLAGTGFAVTAMTARLALEDGVVHWLRPVPPAERINATLSMAGPDVMDIAIAGARQGGLSASAGTVRISGLAAKDQFLALSTDLSGPVADGLQLLRHKRLGLLDRKPLPIRGAGGTLAGRVNVNLPLNEDLSFNDVRIAAKVRTQELRLLGLVAGRDLEKGDVTFDVTSEALKAQGQVVLAGIPAALAVDMDFRPGPASQVVQRAEVSGRTGPAALLAAGLDTAGLLEGGQAAFDAVWSQRRDGAATVEVAADLRGAALAVPGWSKPAGPAAEASARLRLRGDEVVGVEALRATGPGLAVEGRAAMPGGGAAVLVLDQLVLGQTRAAGEIRFPPGGPIGVTLAGPVLDAAPFLDRKAPPGSPAAAGTGPAVHVALRFDRVVSGPGARGLGPVVAEVDVRRGRLERLRVASTGPERLEASIEPGNGRRRLVVSAADGGAVLRALDVTDTVDGGTLSVQGDWDDTLAVPVLAGTAELRSFRVRDAPVLGKLLQAVTVYGVIEALSGPGLSFVAAQVPFSWDGTVLALKDVQAFSVSLGLTAQGRVEPGRKLVDVSGTVVPAYALNSMLGRIPLLGRVFSAEKGGGLLAVNYTVRGRLPDAAVTVNPLSALTPGFLRNLFRIFD